MMNFEKYQRAYFMPPKVTYDWVKKEYIDKAPIWCSVDLRDGNQALVGIFQNACRDRIQRNRGWIPGSI